MFPEEFPLTFPCYDNKFTKAFLAVRSGRFHGQVVIVDVILTVIVYEPSIICGVELCEDNKQMSGVCSQLSSAICAHSSILRQIGMLISCFLFLFNILVCSILTSTFRVWHVKQIIPKNSRKKGDTFCCTKQVCYLFAFCGISRLYFKLLCEMWPRFGKQGA